MTILDGNELQAQIEKHRAIHRAAIADMARESAEQGISEARLWAHGPEPASAEPQRYVPSWERDTAQRYAQAAGDPGEPEPAATKPSVSDPIVYAIQDKYRRLADLLSEAKDAHAEFEKSTGRPDADWPAWYAGYLISRGVRL